MFADPTKERNPAPGPSAVPADGSQHDWTQVLRPHIAPLLGMALRDTFRAALFAFNRFVVCTLTPRGLTWRIEALRTGASLREVLRKHNAVRPVDRVFFIHRATGILLCEVNAGKRNGSDGDTVSGMLTALRDFVRDSFGPEPEGELRTIEVSGVTVCVEPGPHAVLAGVVRGTATPEVRTVFRTVLAKLHTDFSKRLEAFAGETAPFADAAPMMETCLQIESLGLDSRVAAPTWAVLCAAAVSATAACQHWVKWDIRWRSFLSELRQEPGIVILSASRSWNEFRLQGLRDPLALDPMIQAENHGLDPERVSMTWQLYYALSTPFVVERARELLAPPPTVSFSFRNGILHARGSAPTAWRTTAGELAHSIQGVTSLDMSELVAVDSARIEQWDSYVAALRAEPGIIVISAGTKDGRFTISGLRDPLAIAPESILRETGPADADIDSDWRPFVSLDPQIQVTRAKLVLAPPPTVSLSVDGTVLTARGRTTSSWIAGATSAARHLPGITLFDTDAVEDTDLTLFMSVKDQIEEMSFDYLVGTPSLWPGQKTKMDRLNAKLKELDTAAHAANRKYAIEVVGHSNPLSDSATEAAQSEEIARRFLDSLRGLSLDAASIAIRGMGSETSPLRDPSRASPEHNRIVYLRIVPMNGK